MGVEFSKFGHFVPEKRLTNAELAKRFNITEEWIDQRTGIIERRYFEDGGTSEMIFRAVKNAGVEAGYLESIDCIIVATMTPDKYCPSTAAVLQSKLGINHTFAFDIMAACSGFIYALQIADGLIRSSKYKKILVVGADSMSSIVDENDRKTALIFSDGAGFAVLQECKGDSHIVDCFCSLDSNISEAVVIPHGGSLQPVRESNIGDRDQYLRFTSKEVYEGGLELFEKAINELLARNSMSHGDIDLIVPHQANKRMIEELARRMGIPIEKFYINIEYIGNTSAATIPIALSELNESGRLKGKVLLASVGAGFTYASAILNI